MYFSPSKCELSQTEIAKHTGRDVFPMQVEQCKKFLADLKSDLKTLKDIKRRFCDCGLESPNEDGKLQALQRVVQEVLTKGIEYREYDVQHGLELVHHKAGIDIPESNNPRKIIVFSYYADTAEYVADELKKIYPDKVLHKDGTNLDKTAKEEIERHFMACKKGDAAFAASKAKSNEKMILVCTDVLSEGINLNQAGIVINYDIAYNPVRVIQRIGRINRIDQKVFERIYSVIFFPTGPRDTHIDLNNVENIAVGKMMDIHSLLGEDSCILSEEEKPRQAEFIKAISPDEQEKMSVSIDTELDMLYAEGLKRLKLASAQQIQEYEDRLDHLIPRWSVIPAEEHKLFIFKKTFASLFVTEIPDYTNKGTPAKKDLPCAEALEYLMNLTAPGIKSLDFRSKAGDPVWDAYQILKYGMGFDQSTGSNSGQLKKCQKEALDFLNKNLSDLTKEERGKIGWKIRESIAFAQQFLKCKDNADVVRKCFTDELNKTKNFIQNDGSEFMTIGTISKEK